MSSNALPPCPPRTGVEPDADEREFDAFAQHQDPLDIEAATWVTRKRSGLDAQGETDLQAWLDADPRHPEAFADMDGTFEDVQQLPDSDAALLRAGLPGHTGIRAQAAGTVSPAPATAAAESTPHLRPSSPTSSRRPWLSALSHLMGRASEQAPHGQRPLLPRAAVAALAFTALGTAWMGWDHWRQQPVFEQTYATARGQQLTTTLPDAQAPAGATGSTLQLDTATHADVRLYRDRREVRLQDGQAMFAIHTDSERPFHVYAGALRITVVGTRFSVRHTDTGLEAGQTVIAVEEGRVRVTRTIDGNDPPVLDLGEQDSSASTELTAGQTVVADASGHIGPVAHLNTGTSTAWRDGRLSFDQTPLTVAIAEFERYVRTGLVIHDPAVAALPVGGSYSLKQWQRFVETLPQVLPVRLVPLAHATEVVAR